VAEVAVVGDEEVDRGVILGAAFGNRVIEVARVSLNQIGMKATHAVFRSRLFSELHQQLAGTITHQARGVSPLFEPAAC
jgi:hypothetical protein